MNKGRSSREQNIGVRKQQKARRKVPDLAREIGEFSAEGSTVCHRGAPVARSTPEHISIVVSVIAGENSAPSPSLQRLG